MLEQDKEEERKKKDRERHAVYRKTAEYKVYQREYRLKNLEKIRSYDHSRQRKKARNETTRRYHKTAAGKLSMTKSSLKSKYGLTIEGKEEMLKKQNGVCAICGGNDWGGRWGKPHIDHNHKTGKIRGILCSRCNKGIGFFKEDPKRLNAAIEYLRQYNDYVEVCADIYGGRYQKVFISCAESNRQD